MTVLRVIDRKRALLRLVHAGITERGQCPSYEELGRALAGPGFAGTRPQIHYLVLELERDGLLRRTPGRNRSLVVVAPPREQLDAGEVAWCHAHAVAVRALRDRLEGRRREQHGEREP